jgi:hypothetical protein
MFQVHRNLLIIGNLIKSFNTFVYFSRSRTIKSTCIAFFIIFKTFHPPPLLMLNVYTQLITLIIIHVSFYVFEILKKKIISILANDEKAIL